MFDRVITREEYEQAQSKIPELRKLLFDVRYEMALTRDLNKLKELESKVKLIKKEIARTKFTIREYELMNEERKMK